MYAKGTKTVLPGGLSTARVPETWAPVKAKALLEAALDEAERTLRPTIGARPNALLLAIASHGVGR